MAESDIPKYEPAKISMGFNHVWLYYDPDYTPSECTISYYLQKTDRRIVILGTDNGDGGHLFTVTSAVSALYLAGVYQFRVGATVSGEIIPLREGSITIEDDFISSDGGYDSRSLVKKTLDAINETILGTASKSTQETTINGKSLKRYSVSDLLKLKSQYARWYNDEEQEKKIASGLPSDRKILVRFK